MTTLNFFLLNYNQFINTNTNKVLSKVEITNFVNNALSKGLSDNQLAMMIKVEVAKGIYKLISELKNLFNA